MRNACFSFALFGPLAACGGADTDTDSGPSDEVRNVDVDAFELGAITGEVETVACTLSNNVESTCYAFTLVGTPVEHDIGPFCPRNIADDASNSGIWLESGQVYDASGSFIANLATFYNDDQWQLYDATTGEINVTYTQEACEGAARPDVSPEYQNHCVECDIAYVVDTTLQVLIPVTPVRRSSPQEIDFRASKIGVSLGGVVYDPPAPVDAILGAYTVAPFDDCGGHVNPNVGYHYHSATGCAAEVQSTDGHAPLIGYAIDGFGLYGMLDGDGTEPSDLDECRGHEDTGRGYHYHVAGSGENMFIGCFAGEIGSVTE